MLKRKIASAVVGAAVLSALSFAPIASAQSDVSSKVYDPSTGTWREVPPTAPSASAPTVPDSPRRTDVASADSDSLPRYEGDVYAPNPREPGLRPSPYSDLPASGHVGDQFFYKGSGGVSPS